MNPKFYMVDKDQSRCELCLKDNGNSKTHIFESFTLNKKDKFYQLSGAVVHDKCLRNYPDLDEFIQFYFNKINEVFYNSDWGLCPVGDEFEHSFDSQFCQAESPQYNMKEVLNRLLELENTYLKKDGITVIWEKGDEIIQYNFATELIFSGIHVEPLSSPKTFLYHWLYLFQKFDRIFLHNQDCTIFTPHYFEEIYVNDELRKLVED